MFDMEIYQAMYWRCVHFSEYNSYSSEQVFETVCLFFLKWYFRKHNITPLMESVNKPCFTSVISTAISYILGIHIRKDISIAACDRWIQIIYTVCWDVWILIFQYEWFLVRCKTKFSDILFSPFFQSSLFWNAGLSQKWQLLVLWEVRRSAGGTACSINQ